MVPLFASGDIALAIPIVAIAGGILYSIVGTLSLNWRKAKESEHLAIVKQQMLDRGMTADDIAKVVNAGAAKPDHKM